MSDKDAVGTGTDLKGAVEPAAVEESSRSGRFRHRLRNIGALVASIAAIGAVVSGLTGYWSAWKVISNDFFKRDSPSRTVSLITKGPTVAVLPAGNPTKTAALESITDVLAQQLVSSLGKFSLLKVVPRATAANFLNDRDPAEAARASGVDYLVMGEVRPLGEGARVNIHVADLRSRAEVWSAFSDISAEGIKTEMDAYEVGDVSASQISGAIDGAEYKKFQNKPVDELSPYECIIQARMAGALGSQTATLRALACSEQLTTKEPNNAMAWAARSAVINSQRQFGYGLTRDLVVHVEKRLYLNDEMIRAAARAVELAPDDAVVRRYFAQAIGAKCQLDLYRQEAEKALALNPNDPVALGFLGLGFAFMGDWDKGSALAEKAIRLAGPSASYNWWYAPAKRHWWRGEYQQALEDFRHAYIDGFWLSHLDQAYTLPFLNRLDDAKAQVTKLLKLRPDFTIREADAYYRMYCFSPEYIEKMNLALRQAGLPE
ncbi:hypothetical protein H8B02_22630 [Bradyrhizobium sp. Pear77]|uniref:tetratricopeptide repeat protein n=1 Tax=Bradyrhizobium altum TaxID=1571202 RepID=UPI001E350E2F|nr:hypothetical protein [Bradyrhizobium altum]MCC8956123.1 hypothetical protein [Bradyrhizobium altum]